MAEFTVTVDDAAAREALRKLGTLGDDPKVLKKIALAAKQEAYDTFRHETDPWGNPWPPLSPLTLEARVERGNDSKQKLIDTGALYKSIEGHVEGDSVLLTAGSGLPDERAWWNQFGRAGSLPQRAFFPVSTPSVANPPQDWWNRVLIEPVEEAIARATK